MEIEGRDTLHDVILKGVFIFITGSALKFSLVGCLAKYHQKDPINLISHINIQS